MVKEQQEKNAVRLSTEIRALFQGANFAHLATLLPDGTPHIDPVWVDAEGDAILVCSGGRSLKSKNTKRDARVALSIVAMDNPYNEAQLRGRVVEQRADTDFAVIDRLSRRYTGKPFPFRDNPAERVVLVIAVDRARHLVLPFVHAPVVSP
ncbi:MAG TPA: TIGR03618 family F420-dependent PPOX class oxidoreductase [Candidatus Binatia bacterium]|jgi:PPOX class probable F420-dependent enzyme